MRLKDIEASFYRYLYQNIEVSEGIKVFENIYLQTFDEFTKWVVVDSLTNSLGANPKQIFFVHCATQKWLDESKEVIISLVDMVEQLVKEQTRIDVYDFPNETVIGEMEIVKISLSPIMGHQNGGALRTFTVEIVHEELN